MPKPNPGEDHDDFIDRCMADDEANESFPDPAQRRAFCESQWERKDNKKMNRIIVPHTILQPRQRFFNRIPDVQYIPFGILAKDGVTEITLYDEIGFFGVSAKQFKQWLKESGEVLLKINSPGGDIFDGIAIYNDIVDHRRKKGNVNVEITGLAASAASIVAMAGGDISIAHNAFLMIHNSWGITIGNKNDHEHMRDTLDQIDLQIAQTYSNRTGIDRQEVLGMMDEETWFNGEEAVDNGFADEMIPEGAEGSAFDLTGRFKNCPRELLISNNSNQPSLTRNDAGDLIGSLRRRNIA